MADCKYLHTYRPARWLTDYWCKSPCHPENLKGNSKTYLASEIENLPLNCIHDTCVSCKYYPNEICIEKLSEEDKQKVLNNDDLEISQVVVLATVVIILVFILLGIGVCSFSKDAGAVFIGIGLILSIPLAVYTKYTNG